MILLSRPRLINGFFSINNHLKHGPIAIFISWTLFPLIPLPLLVLPPYRKLISRHFTNLTMMAPEHIMTLAPKLPLLIVVIIFMSIDYFHLISLALFVWYPLMANDVDLLDMATVVFLTLVLVSVIAPYLCIILRRFLLLSFPRPQS
jgi:hypothetical protein